MSVRISLLAAALAATSAAAIAAPSLAKAQGQASSRQSADTPQPISKADFTKNIDGRFASLDSNKDGSLNKAEITAAQTKALQQLAAVQQQRIEAEFNKLDTNKDKQLSMTEFRAAAPNVRAKETPDQMLSQLDSNKDGKVSTAEYRAPPLASFDKADTNHDGIVSPQEAQQAR